jgi:hypothetical protein
VGQLVTDKFSIRCLTHSFTSLHLIDCSPSVETITSSYTTVLLTVIYKTTGYLCSL